MDVQQTEAKEERFSTGQWLRWGEYGVALAIIPGLFLAILTGQFAFVASPLTLSLWLNLFRRQSGDRNTLSLLHAEQKSFMYRHEAFIASTKRERAELLMEHAAELDSRDHPQFADVIGFRLRCIEQNRDSLQTYLEESCRNVETSLKELQGVQQVQFQSLEQLTQQFESLTEPESVKQHTQEQLQCLSTQIERLENLLVPQHQLLSTELEARLKILEQSLDAIELQGFHSNPQEQWTAIETPLLDRLDALHLNFASLSRQGAVPENRVTTKEDIAFHEVLDEMHLALAEQLDEWEALNQDQGYQLQRLDERLITLKQNLEQTYQAILENSAKLEQTLMQSQFSALEFSEIEVLPEFDVEQIKITIEQLYARLEDLVQSVLQDTVKSMLQPVIDAATVQIEKTEMKMTNVVLSDAEQLDQLLTPLLQHVSNCDEKLSRILSVQVLPEIEGTLFEVESRVRNIVNGLNSFGDMEAEALALHTDLQVKLSMIRYRVEELKSQATIELEQIPYMIENYLRQRYPIQK